MQDCIFCKIIAGDIPAQKIYEDQWTLAFLDITPANPGHVLVIPKRHYETILDVEDDDLMHLIKVVKRIGKIVQETTSAVGFNIGQNNGEAAGQSVFHAHWHVIPRHNKDEFGHWPRGSYSEGEIEVMAEELRTTLHDHFNGGMLDVQGKRPLTCTDGIVVNDEGKVLIAKRGVEPFKGLWGIPGGKVDYDETVEQALVREVKEETGLEVQVIGHLGVYSGPDRYEYGNTTQTVSNVYVTRVTGGDLQTCVESTAFQWIAQDEIPEQMCFDHKTMVQDYFSQTT